MVLRLGRLCLDILITGHYRCHGSIGLAASSKKGEGDDIGKEFGIVALSAIMSTLAYCQEG